MKSPNIQAYILPTSVGQDNIIRETFIESVNQGYDLIGNQCSQAVQKALDAANINTKGQTIDIKTGIKVAWKYGLKAGMKASQRQKDPYFPNNAFKQIKKIIQMGSQYIKQDKKAILCLFLIELFIVGWCIYYYALYKISNLVEGLLVSTILAFIMSIAFLFSKRRWLQYIWLLSIFIYIILFSFCWCAPLLVISAGSLFTLPIILSIPGLNFYLLILVLKMNRKNRPCNPPKT